MNTNATPTATLTVKISPNDKGNPPGKLADTLDMVCNELERDFPERPIADVASPRTFRMKFAADPYYVLSVSSPRPPAS